MIKRVGILILLIAGSAIAAVPATQHVRTTHYELEAEVSQAAAIKMGALLEAYFERASEYFGVTPEPRERLRVIVLANFERFIQRLKEDGRYLQIAQVADGAYCENNRTIYLAWSNPAALAHDMLLHEATHQFLAVIRKNKVKSSVYEEGVAEYLGHHRWDNGRLTLGISPELEPHDRPAQALARLRARFGGDLSRVVLEQEEPVAHYGDAWAVYAFLAEEESARLKKWAELLDDGSEAQAAWESAMEGVAREEISGRYKAWLEKQQWNWECGAGTWGQETDWIEGASNPGRLSFAVLKTPMDDLTVEMEAQSERDQAGLAFGFTSGMNGTLVTLLGSGELRGIEIAQGKTVANQFPALKQRRPWRWTMRARRDGDEMIISIDGKDYGRTKVAPGSRCGVSVIGTARFRVVEEPAGSRPRL